MNKYIVYTVDTSNPVEADYFVDVPSSSWINFYDKEKQLIDSFARNIIYRIQKVE